MRKPSSPRTTGSCWSAMTSMPSPSLVPDFLHEEIACAALEAGKHVFCEKPMAITVEGCDRMLETARASGKKLFIGHNMRYMDIFRTMKGDRRRRVIGEIKAVWCATSSAWGDTSTSMIGTRAATGRTPSSCRRARTISTRSIGSPGATPSA